MIAEISLRNLSVSGWVAAVMMVGAFIHIAIKLCRVIRTEAKNAKEATKEVKTCVSTEYCRSCGQTFKVGHAPCLTCGEVAQPVTQREIALVERVGKLEALCKEADEYLNTNDMTNIGHGSILHKKFQEAWKDGVDE